MAKLIISVDGQDLRQIALSQQRMTIGRKLKADIPLDDLAVSGEHARVTTILGDSFLEDLDSTTGTSVNGAAVKKHVLRDGDVIGIGRYTLRYAAAEQALIMPAKPESACDGEASAGGVTLMSAVSKAGHAHADDSSGSATISLLNGRQAGSRVTLTKSVTTFGKAGLQVAAISRDDERYLLRHVEGERLTAVNGVDIAAEGHVLQEGDVIELAGARLKFSRLTPS